MAKSTNKKNSIQWDGNNIDAVRTLIGSDGVLMTGSSQRLIIKTKFLSGVLKEKDYIVRHEDGRLAVMSEESYKKSYDDNVGKK